MGKRYDNPNTQDSTSPTDDPWAGTDNAESTNNGKDKPVFGILCVPPVGEKIGFEDTTKDITPALLGFEAEKARFIGIGTIVNRAKRIALRAARKGDRSVNLTFKSSGWMDLAIEKLRQDKFTVNVEKGRREVKIWIGW